MEWESLSRTAFFPFHNYITRARSLDFQQRTRARQLMPIDVGCVLAPPELLVGIAEAAIHHGAWPVPRDRLVTALEAQFAHLGASLEDEQHIVTGNGAGTDRNVQMLQSLHRHGNKYARHRMT